MAKIKTKRYLECPNCGDYDFSVDHVLDKDTIQSYGPWHCTICNHEVRFKAGQGVLQDVTTKECPRQPMLCLFRIRDLYVVVDSYSMPDDGKPDWYDYLFHSHQCPTNLARHVVEVFCPEEGQDPHGVFRFIAAIPDEEDNRTLVQDKCTTLQELFFAFQTDGQEAWTRWPESQRGLIPGLAQLQDAYRRTNRPKC